MPDEAPKYARFCFTHKEWTEINGFTLQICTVYVESHVCADLRPISFDLTVIFEERLKALSNQAGRQVRIQQCPI